MTNPVTRFPETRHSLLAKLQTDDDEDAWLQFVAIYRPVIYRMACRRGLQDADAQDLTQKVLLSVAGAIESWEQRDGTPFRHWLRKIASNAILKVLTRQPKDMACGGSTVMQVLGEAVQDGDLFEQELELERQREAFLRAAAIVKTDVEPDTWQAFQLAVIEGLPIEEVAGRCGKSVGAAYAARGRVMKRLQQISTKILEGIES